MKGIASFVIGVVALLLGPAVHTVSAQESLGGFTLGMSREAALAKLKADGAKIEEEKGTPETYLIRRGGTISGENIGFCAGVLVSYRMEIKGGVDAFIRQLETETARRGQGEYTATTGNRAKYFTT